MPYQIGRVFSDAVYNTIERGRDRAHDSAQNQGPAIETFHRKTRAPADLEIAAMRAAGEGDQLDLQRERQNQEWALALEEMDRKREEAMRSGDVEQAKLVAGEEARLLKQANADRDFDLKAYGEEADVALRAGGLQRDKDKLALETRKFDAEQAEAEAAADASERAAKMETVTTISEVRKTLRDLFLAATKKVDGEVDPVRARANARALWNAAQFAVSPDGKALPRAEIEKVAQEYLRSIEAAINGEKPGGVDIQYDEGLDMALGGALGGGASAPQTGGR